MIKSKKDRKTIFEILTFILVYTCIFFINRPIISFSFLILCIASWSYNFYSKRKFKKGNAKYLLFPANNDRYFRTASITVGSAVIAGSTLVLIFSNTLTNNTSIGLSIGILVLFNGLFDLPHGMIKIQSNWIEITGLSYKVDQNELTKIEIYTDRILLISSKSELISVENFTIDLHSAELIEKYIADHKTNLDLSIINSVR